MNSSLGHPSATTAQPGQPAQPHARAAPPAAALVLVLALALALTGCTQSRATTITATPTPTEAPSTQGGEASATGPVLGTVRLWLGEHGILLWTPRVDDAGTYEFQVENRGEGLHDVVVARVEAISAIPSRSERALLQEIPVVARSRVIQPGETIAFAVNLERAGSYVLLSGQGTDFGRGMATTLAVGRGAPALPVPVPAPPADDRETVAAYLVDRALFLHRREVDAGIVTFAVQNLGPSPHDLVAVQWRGDPDALPVNEDGGVLMDGLTVLGRVGPLAPGESADLDVETEEDFAYVVFSTLPGDYGAGMSAQVVPR